jgi:CheY-like chemotaxis protein
MAQMASMAPAAPQHYSVVPDRAFARLAAGGQAPGRSGASAAPSGSPGERLLGLRILVVEDEGLLALELQLAFEDEGAEVVGPVQSLARALETVTADTAIDLAILDVDLAGENVYPVAELLAQRSVPFAFHTGHASRAELSALFPGSTTFIKPTLPETLIGHLAKIAR